MHPCKYYFYTPNVDGTFEAISGEKLEKVSFDTKQEFENALSSYPRRFESDLNPLERIMMDCYAGKQAPKLIIGFVDIETDYDPKIGYSTIKNPYAPINAITLYRSDLECYFTLAIPPAEGVTLPQEMLDDNYFICRTERELLEQFFSLVEDTDILSGWNSEFFDIPYIGKRIELLFGPQALKKLGFELGPTPRWTETERFKGAKEKDISLDLMSRVHLDYMRLFKKFNLGGRQSFSLEAISNSELIDSSGNAMFPKLAYTGTLADLYKNDFVHFAKYNRRDVEILVQLNAKFKYIELANTMVHEATVYFGAIFGSVQLIDTAIMNYCHVVLDKICFDRQQKAGAKIEGGMVLSPIVGFHKWVASCDINSLYPTMYRSLNLSPEKIVGQLMEYEEGWRAWLDAKKNPLDEAKQNRVVVLQLEGAGKDGLLEVTAKDLNELLIDKKFAISAYGTILDQSNGEGLLAAVLSFWFKDRKKLQGEKKKYHKLAEAALKAANGNHTDPTYIENNEQYEYFDMLQGVKKVLLNSSYGATLNAFCRFHDSRLGASTTGSGREVTTFMLETITEQLNGKYYKLTKTITVGKDGDNENVYTIDAPAGSRPVMSDTDSCYFVMDALVNDSESAVELADAIVDFVNSEFPRFMQEYFNTQPEFSNHVRAVREIVAKTGIIRAKKNYIFAVINNEGDKYPDDAPYIKLQGGDLKVSSTPEVIRTFLREITLKILAGTSKAEISADVLKFREQLKGAAGEKPLDFATVTSVKTLDEQTAKWERTEKLGLGRANLPGHIRAAINHNQALVQYAPTEAPIKGGSKVKVLWLKENEHDFKSMAFPSEMEILPTWFDKHFAVDIAITEQKLVDEKVGNTFDPIGWEVPTLKSTKFGSLVSFD
jgi:DNA polymerase elongation subunit (family B)